MLFITETWLHTGIPSALLDPNSEYVCIRNDRAHTKGGGVCAFIRNCFRVLPIIIADEYDDIEIICFDLVMRHDRVRFFVLYRPPNYDQYAVGYSRKLVKCL